MNKITSKQALLVIILALAFACKPTEKSNTQILNKANFETNINGKATQLYTLENNSGMKVFLSNYGARILSICVPDKNGKIADVVLGFNSIEEYRNNEYNALIGPYANRIGDAQFTINQEVYKLAANDNGNCLHNGLIGFKHSVFDAVQNKNSVTMTITSADGEFGFPGNKTVKITYTLTNDNELRMDYEATTDKACPFNLTNHAYFNLRGEGNGNILGHIMYIDADSTTAINSELIPTGEIVSIKSTDMDFTTPKIIGERINSEMDILKLGNGYDHNYILNKNQNTNEMTLAARVIEPESGRMLEVLTTEPAIQFYAGNFQDGKLKGKSGQAYKFRTGFCLETQHYPDSPNHNNFPTTILQPNEILKTTTVYKFSTEKK